MGDPVPTNKLRDALATAGIVASVAGCAALAAIPQATMAATLASLAGFLGCLIVANWAIRLLATPRVSKHARKRWAAVFDCAYYASAAIGVILYYGADEVNRADAIRRYQGYVLASTLNDLERKERQDAEAYGTLAQHRDKAIPWAIAWLKSAWMADARTCDTLPRILTANAGHFAWDVDRRVRVPLSQLIDITKDPDIILMSHQRETRSEYLAVNSLRVGDREAIVAAWRACYHQILIDEALGELADGFPTLVQTALTSPSEPAPALDSAGVSLLEKRLEQMAVTGTRVIAENSAYSGYRDRVARQPEMKLAQKKLDDLAHQSNARPEGHPYLTFLRYREWVYAALIALSLKLTPAMGALTGDAVAFLRRRRLGQTTGR